MNPLRQDKARKNWEQLVRKALLRVGDEPGATGWSRLFGAPSYEATPALPSALGNTSIDAVLAASNEIQSQSPQVARILCEYAYRLSQNLDPKSQGRGVLQFKTGLLSIIKQKRSKKEGEQIDRSNDVKLIFEFYKTYREKLDELEDQEEKFRQPVGRGDVVINADDKKRAATIKKMYETSRVLNEVLDAYLKETSPEERESLLGDQQLKKNMERDAAKIAEFKSYNIIPLETPSADPFVLLPEIKGAHYALKLGGEIPTLPDSYPHPNRPLDMFDLLQYTFGFQEDNVKNQREHVILLLANTQARLSLPDDRAEGFTVRLDDGSMRHLHDKVLDNYKKWCSYLRKTSVLKTGNSTHSAPVQLLLTCLYLVIWGEAGNVRFLPECICYIFHNMASKLLLQLGKTVADRGKIDDGDHEFLDGVVKPIYDIIAAEAKHGQGKKGSHSQWRTYDDLNEYFWSDHCFTLGWPWSPDSSFFLKPGGGKQDIANEAAPGRRKQTRMGKTLFVEHRTGFHIYHSFHRLWIFFIMMLQGLGIFAFSTQLQTLHRIKVILSLGPTFVLMKFVQSLLDVILMYGAYASTRGQNVARIFVRFIWFSASSAFVMYLYVRVMSEPDLNSSSALFNIYILVLGCYAGFQLIVSTISRISALRVQADKIGGWSIIRFISWVHQERYYIGRGLYERTQDFLLYMLFWIVVLVAKFSFSYFFQIKPMVEPTRIIIGQTIENYKWHDFVSKSNHNALTLVALWAPVVMIYFVDTQVWYTVFSALWGGLDGARLRLGEIRSLSMLRKRFNTFPEEFVNRLLPSVLKLNIDTSSAIGQAPQKDKVNALKFAPLWNEIIQNLRLEDYISNKERDWLLMPKNTGSLQLVQWPLFLLANKILLAVDLAAEHKGSQYELQEKIFKDEYMQFAVQEAYFSVQRMMMKLVNNEAELWVKGIFADIEASIKESALATSIVLKRLGGPGGLVAKLATLTGILEKYENPVLLKNATLALQEIFEVVMKDVLSLTLREKYEGWSVLEKARRTGALFSDLNWPSADEENEEIKRLNSLLTVKDSASNIPKNLEARRRLEFFSNSLFMDMPATPSVRQMFSFSVFTPYYAEDVIYGYAALNKENEDGITILFYLQKIFPDEWKNYLERVKRTEAQLERELARHLEKLKENKEPTEISDTFELLQLRLWASYRGQTLARTVRGMMYYRSALILQSGLEAPGFVDEEAATRPGAGAMPASLMGQSIADMKFTYVVSCQIYGKQKQQRHQQAADIAYLLQTHEGLRVAYIDTVEKIIEGKTSSEYFSKLVKADATGKDQEIYSIRLPGNPLLGEGKPENQNHAIIFTRGEAIQTIDMNQDNYFEEAFKMRNLLQEFDVQHGLRKPSILGVREHVFTGSVSSLAWFMSNQETSFVTLGQRVLAKPLKVRMHYGHPDVFDRIFHITRGGISKASKVINISEDIYAGFNSTLRQGNVTHHEYIQVGKGRDVGLNQIATFEAKVASGNGEQVLSRDIYRLGQLFDFFRMLSFFYTSIGFYVCTMMTVLTVYVFLYGKAYLALSGVGAALEENVVNSTALQTALNTQFLFQIGIFTAIPMIMGFILEQGVLKAFISFITMQLQLASVFFTFSLGTRTHYFGRTILHGGAKYRATGRGFVVQHIPFAENYRLYSRSHFVKGLEVALLLIVYGAYGTSKGTVSYVLLTFSSWFLAISWLYAPYIFNPSGFEWQKTVEDFDKWTNWIFYKGGVGVNSNESWEAWWEEEQAHITSPRGRIWEIILSFRFFIFQYGVVYSLSATGSNTSLGVYGISWLVLVGLLVVFKAFTFSQKASAKFQLVVRLGQGILFLLLIAGIVLSIVYTELSLGDVFASLLALLPTGWAILSICLAIRPVVEYLRLWKSVRAFARFYDALMGMLIFVPIAVLSWFPFVSTFQTRLVFNQAFSRGLEISLILAGNKPNQQ